MKAISIAYTVGNPPKDFNKWMNYIRKQIFKMYKK